MTERDGECLAPYCSAAVLGHFQYIGNHQAIVLQAHDQPLYRVTLP